MPQVVRSENTWRMAGCGYKVSTYTNPPRRTRLASGQFGHLPLFHTDYPSLRHVVRLVFGWREVSKYHFDILIFYRLHASPSPVRTASPKPPCAVICAAPVHKNNILKRIELHRKLRFPFDNSGFWLKIKTGCRPVRAT